MSVREEIQAAIDKWNNGLDSGDIERIVASCHPDVMTVNERQPVTTGTQAIRDKYNPRIAAAEITSGYDIEDLQDYGDTVIVSGRFYGTMKMRDTGEVKTPEGRLVLGYKRDKNGAMRRLQRNGLHGEHVCIYNGSSETWDMIREHRRILRLLLGQGVLLPRRPTPPAGNDDNVTEFRRPIGV